MNPTGRRLGDCPDGQPVIPPVQLRATGVQHRLIFVQHPMERQSGVRKVQLERRSMKISNCLIALAVMVVGAGCRSADTHVASTTATSQQAVQTSPPRQAAQASVPQQDSGASTVQRGSAGDLDYTVQVIPNAPLTATSREGDKPKEVYSSNIIAVYVHPRNGVTVNSTNSPAVPNPPNNPEPARKEP